MVGPLEVTVELWVGWVGGWGGPYDFSVTPVQTRSQELGVRSLEFRVGSMELELVWTSSGLSLDNLQNRVAKKFASFLPLSWDLS